MQNQKDAKDNKSSSVQAAKQMVVMKVYAKEKGKNEEQHRS